MFLSRLALEIFDEKEYAIELENEANAIKNDIEKYMTVESNGRRIFLEGIASLDPHTKKNICLMNVIVKRCLIKDFSS